MKYLHYVPRADDARLVASAFATGVEGASAASRRKAGAEA
jgi:hypothetical protein